MLELRGVSVSYGGRAALSDVALSFAPGEVLALVGPNGGGKSTLLKAAAGLLPVSGGTVRLDGAPITDRKPRELARRVSYLPQSRETPDITALRLVLHGRFPYMGYPRRARAEDYEIALAALEAVNAAALADRPLRELSGGQRQRVYIAMALAQGTDTVLLDEPTAYLDIAHQLQTAALARQLADQGKAVVLAIHDLPLAMQAADRLAVLDHGRLAAVGTPEEIYKSGVVSMVFGVTLERVETGMGARYVCAGEV